MKDSLIHEDLNTEAVFKSYAMEEIYDIISFSITGFQKTLRK